MAEKEATTRAPRPCRKVRLSRLRALMITAEAWRKGDLYPGARAAYYCAPCGAWHVTSWPRGG